MNTEARKRTAKTRKPPFRITPEMQKLPDKLDARPVAMKTNWVFAGSKTVLGCLN